jgi:hypothetical protein
MRTGDWRLEKRRAKWVLGPGLWVMGYGFWLSGLLVLTDYRIGIAAAGHQQERGDQENDCS